MSAEIDEVRAYAAMMEADRDQWRDYAETLKFQLEGADKLNDLQEDYIKRLEDGYI